MLFSFGSWLLLGKLDSRFVFLSLSGAFLRISLQLSHSGGGAIRLRLTLLCCVIIVYYKICILYCVVYVVYIMLWFRKKSSFA